MKVQNVVFLVFLLLCVFGCDNDMDLTPGGGEVDPKFETVNYIESFEDFINPERGFYRYSETFASDYDLLTVSELKAMRNLTGGSGATYQTYNSLLFRYFILDDFVDSELDMAFLQNVRSDLETLREAGNKVIPRFCYTINAQSGSCPEDFICPPYGDASKDIVLRHIEQLSEVINENRDVILCMQMGFIGTWGENYYTDFFGDASSNEAQQKLLDENWEDRIEVLNKMLESFDSEIMVQVRYPQMKQRAVYGINAKTDVAALTEAEAFSGDYKSRIGLHNDCLFANFNDFGTYEDYGNSSSERKADVPRLKPYFAEEGRFVYVGGETCYDGYNPQSNCSPKGLADTELRELHYTYLNAQYNNDVNNDWVEGDCMDAIKLNLGYRFVLDSIKYEKELSEDRQLDLRLAIKNVGYASVMKNREAQFIIRNNETAEEFVYAFETDMRRWEGGVELNEVFDIQEDVADGNYECFLFFPDNHASISARPEYSIRLGNETIWEVESGYNKLGFSIKI